MEIGMMQIKAGMLLGQRARAVLLFLWTIDRLKAREQPPLCRPRQNSKTSRPLARPGPHKQPQTQLEILIPSTPPLTTSLL